MRLLKRHSTEWPALLFLSLICLPACGPAAAFKIETTSPGGQYRLELEGRGEPANAGVADLQRQVVTLKSDKGSRVVATDDRFFIEDTGDFFLQRYPAHEWVNDSTLRFGDRSPGDRFQDRLIVTNRRDQPFDLRDRALWKTRALFDLRSWSRQTVGVERCATASHRPTRNRRLLPSV